MRVKITRTHLEPLKKKNSLPPFMTDEIENLQMEINSYRRQLQQIEKGVSQ